MSAATTRSIGYLREYIAIYSLLSASLVDATATTTAISATIDGRKVTVPASWAKNSPILPFDVAAKPLALVVAGDGCTPIKMDPFEWDPTGPSLNRVPIGRSVVLLVRRGGCSVEEKFSHALTAGASALLIADSLAAKYAAPANATAATMALTEPCAVDCVLGRGTVDVRTLGVADVLRGMPTSCPAPAGPRRGSGCQTQLCAFTSSPVSSPSREVCCVRALPRPTDELKWELMDLAASSTPTSTAAKAAPAALGLLSVSLPMGQALEAACVSPAASASASNANPATSACELRIVDSAADANVAWDPSAIIVWLIGTCVAGLAGYLGGGSGDGEEEPIEVVPAPASGTGTGNSGGGGNGGGGGGGTPREIAMEASLQQQAALAAGDLDASTAISFLGIASVFLVGLYYLIQLGFTSSVFIFSLAFLFAGSSSMATVLLTPLFEETLPSHLKQTRVPLPSALRAVSSAVMGYAQSHAPLPHLMALGCSFTIAITWFLNRTSPWMYLLQDLMAANVCVLFVRTLRLPSLKIGTLFLGLMFLYDIFMVFISPLIFGSSVMLAVATAGASRESIDDAGKCHRSAAENNPMLYSIPRLAKLPSLYDGVYSPPLSDKPGSTHAPTDGGLLWRLSGASGDYAMLGLGDIVLPALAITLARRLDLALAKSGSSHSLYFPCAAIGYGLGLGVTLAANTYGWTFNDVQGQPALLYLVPGVVGALLLRAACRGEVRDIWEGTPLPLTPIVGTLVCDGCGSQLHGDDEVWSDPARDRDYKEACAMALPAEQRANLKKMTVNQRCGLPPAKIENNHNHDNRELL